MPEEKKNNFKEILSSHFKFDQDLDELADSIVQSTWRPVSIGLAIGLPVIYVTSKYLIGRRYSTAAHIPPEVYQKSRTIRGKVVAVGDSDNFRIYHTPGFGWGWLRSVPKTRKELKDQTIQIRIAGVDAPEGAHFGMPAQPFSKEAKDFLTKLVLNRQVQVQLYNRDQYQRMVGMAYVRTPPFYFKKNVSLEMVKAGLASLYVAKGAEYGGILNQLEQAESKAKRGKKGIWSQKKYVSPGEHKAKYLGGGK